MNKKLIWGIIIGVVIILMAIVLFGYQFDYKATLDSDHSVITTEDLLTRYPDIRDIVYGNGAKLLVTYPKDWYESRWMTSEGETIGFWPPEMLDKSLFGQLTGTSHYGDNIRYAPVILYLSPPFQLKLMNQKYKDVFNLFSVDTNLVASSTQTSINSSKVPAGIDTTRSRAVRYKIEVYPATARELVARSQDYFTIIN